MAAYLTSRGNTVQLVRDHFMPSTEDWVIAQAASNQNATVVTWNRRHFKALAARRNAKGQPTYPGMSVVTFRCSHADGLRRIQEVIDELEMAYQVRVVRNKRRLLAEVGLTMLRLEDLA